MYVRESGRGQSEAVCCLQQREREREKERERERESRVCAKRTRRVEDNQNDRVSIDAMQRIPMAIAHHRLPFREHRESGQWYRKEAQLHIAHP